jgi:hypothetical protein
MQFFTKMVCEPLVQCSSYFPCPCLSSCSTHDLKFRIRNFTAGIPNFSEFLVLQRFKGRSKHGNCACVWSLIAAVCHVERARARRHTHISNYFLEEWCDCCSRCVWSHVTATAACGSPSLAAQENNSDRLLNERHRPLSTGSGFVHRNNSWMLHAECRFTKHTHTHTADEFSTKRKVQVLPQRQYLDIFRGFPGLRHICTPLLEFQWTVSDHLYS